SAPCNGVTLCKLSVLVAAPTFRLAVLEQGARVVPTGGHEFDSMRPQIDGVRLVTVRRVAVESVSEAQLAIAIATPTRSGVVVQQRARVRIARAYRQRPTAFTENDGW